MRSSLEHCYIKHRRLRQPARRYGDSWARGEYRAEVLRWATSLIVFMHQYELSRASNEASRELYEMAENRLEGKLAVILSGAILRHTGVTTTIDPQGSWLDGFTNRIVVVGCDLKQKQQRGRMWWQIEGEPDDYLALMYLTNLQSPIAYLVAFDSYLNLYKKSKDKILSAPKNIRADKFFTLNHLDPQVESEPW